MAEVKRAVRVAERLREELSWLITRDVRDPRVSLVVVSRVEMSDDLKHARVYVRALEPDKRDEAMEGLERASGMLRREVTKRTKLRFAPELRFYYDEGQDKVLRIEELLEEVRRDNSRDKSGR